MKKKNIYIYVYIYTIFRNKRIVKREIVLVGPMWLCCVKPKKKSQDNYAAATVGVLKSPVP